jgi:hypothetical protein
MNRDPIVEEVRQVRERLLAKFGGDLSQYVDHLIEAQEQDRDRLVTREEVLQRKRETERCLSTAEENDRPTMP